ncbi:MAG: chitobiase/beta-hexosaminidase C-terminal domain-containing protein, partial [Bacteroidaceae bacterium]|nr:chitobiase/beta-hexosaminidase C-terminal domain-containing protein [Bacteroidaceae bacterium]
MRKFLLSIFCCLMAVAGVQAQETTATFNFADLYGTTTLSSVSSKTVDGITISYAKNSAQNAAAFNKDGTLRLYYGSNNGNSATFTAETGKKITSVVVTASSTSYAPDVKYSVDNANAVKGTWSNTTLTISGIKASAVTIQNVGVAQLRTTVIKVTYVTDAGGETPEPDQPETPEAPAAPTLPASCNFDNSMIVEITNIADGATAYYTTDGTTPSATNGTEYTASFEITATTTVKAVAVNEGVSSEVASATYTKNEPVTPPAEGEVVDVLNRELTGISGTTYTSWSGKTSNSSAVYAGQSAGGNDAIQLRSSNSNSGIITTKSGGKVKKISIVWNDATGSRTLNIYGKNSPYTSPEDLYKTDKQGELLGQITKATGRATDIEVDGDYEYIGLRSNSGAMYINEINITWEASAGVTPVAPNAPVLTESQTFKGCLEVTITSDATVYYTTDGTTPSATNGTEYTAPFEITATTTVKAVAVNEVGESEVAEATYTLLVVEETEGYYVKVTSEPADWTGKYLVVYEEGADAYVFNGKDQANGYVAATIDGAVIKANSELDAVAVTIATMEDGYSIMTADGYISGTASANKLNFSTTEQLNTIAMGTDGVDINAGRYLRFNSAAGDMRFRYYNQTYGESVQLYKYVTELPSYQLSVTDAGYATLFLDFPATIPAFEGDDAGAYIVTGVKDGNWLNLKKVESVLPANTGIIVKANEGDYTFTYSTDEAADVTGNLLKGTIATTSVEGEAYVLGYTESRTAVVFGKAKMNGTSWVNNAYKAYLPVSALPAGANAAYYSFRFGEGTTGISEVKGESGEVKAIFDLTGRRVEAIAAPGIYIV